MNRLVHRYGGNVLVLFGLAIVTLAGLDHLASWLGWRPIFGCWLRPVLMFSQAVALWAVSIGALLALIPWTRPLGFSLIGVGILVATLPGVLAAHLGVFCVLP